jgi:hypothetical protein
MTVTFRSWDQRILAVLPPALAAEFPAQLSHRSAISTSLFSWMRSSFNYGMGSKQFADALRMQHILRYDMMELQYLNHLSSFALNGWLGQKFAAFPPLSMILVLLVHIFTPRMRHSVVTFMTILLMNTELRSTSILPCLPLIFVQSIIVIR